MAVYDIFEVEKPGANKDLPLESDALPDPSKDKQTPSLTRDQFFSSMLSRLFFLALLAVDLLWLSFALMKLAIYLVLSAVFFKSNIRKKGLVLAWLSVRRALVCGLSLFIATMSPGFGIMIACTYFLMYDKKGVEEVVPSSLQEQFKEFFPTASDSR